MTPAVLKSQVSASSSTRWEEWVAMPSSAEADSRPARASAPWKGASHAESAVSTGQATAASIRDAVRPWYEQDGAIGMREPVEHLRRLARRIEPRTQFSTPEVFSVEEDGTVLTSVDMVVFIPEESDGMAFRDAFFEALVDTLDACDRVRLAVGVGRLGPAA